MKTIQTSILENVSKNKLEGLKKTLTDTKLLLPPDKAKEKRALNLAGFNHFTDIEQEAQGNLLTREILNSTYDAPIISMSEALEHSQQFGLAISKTGKYQGHFPLELSSFLAEFMKKHRSEIGESYGANSDAFYLMASPRSFTGENRSLLTQFLNIIFFIPLFLLPKGIKKDSPVLLYRIPNNRNYFAVLYGWGQKTNWFRKLIFSIKGDVVWDAIWVTFVALFFLVPTGIGILTMFLLFPKLHILINTITPICIGLIRLIFFSEKDDRFEDFRISLKTYFKSIEEFNYL